MIEKIDHVAIAVKSLAEGEALLAALGFRCERRETITDQGVQVAFFNVAGVHVELLEPVDPQGAIGRFLGDRRAVIHHLAFASNGLEQDVRLLQAQGLRFVDSEPRVGANGKRIVFIHPKSAANLLLELCQPAARCEPAST